MQRFMGIILDGSAQSSALWSSTLERGILELSHGGCPLRINTDLGLERSAMDLGFIEFDILELSNGGCPLRISMNLGLRDRPWN